MSPRFLNSLSARLTGVFVVLLLACSGASAWLQMRAARGLEQELVQRLSLDLARHIVAGQPLVTPAGLNRAALPRLFDMLMVVNPGVEVYLLGPDGQVEAYSAPQERIVRERVDLAPIRRLLAGDALPIMGDDPRQAGARKVFSVAPLEVDGRLQGYIYVVLQGEAYDALARTVGAARSTRTALASLVIVTVLALAGGVLAFALITRRLRALSREVDALEAGAGAVPEISSDGLSSGGLRSTGLSSAGLSPVAPSSADLSSAGAPSSANLPSTDLESAGLESGGLESAGLPDGGGVWGGALTPRSSERTLPRDEIDRLRDALTALTQRVNLQWRALRGHDQQRRDLLASISHDLRTPLTALHGALETLAVKSGSLSDTDGQRYLQTALGQSRQVGRLAQQLFELARLEHGGVRLESEVFVLPELIQDVLQKFELAAEARQIRLRVDFPAQLPRVYADLGLVERVLTNLLDNALRHSPAGEEIVLSLRPLGGRVGIEVADHGAGVPAALRADLFRRPAPGTRPDGGSGGFGLLVVHRILGLHGASIRLVERPGWGAVFSFDLPAAPQERQLV